MTQLKREAISFPFLNYNPAVSFLLFLVSHSVCEIFPCPAPQICRCDNASESQNKK